MRLKILFCHLSLEMLATSSVTDFLTCKMEQGQPLALLKTPWVLMRFYHCSLLNTTGPITTIMVVILPENQRKHMKSMFSSSPKTGQGADPCSPFCHFVGPPWVNQMATRAARPDAAAGEENFSVEKNQACSPTNSNHDGNVCPRWGFQGRPRECMQYVQGWEAVRQKVQESSPWSQASWVSGTGLSLINYVARSIMPSGP